MKAFDSLRLVAYVIGGIIGLVFLARGCADRRALSNAAKEDFLILTSTFEKSVSRGRFQGYGKKLYVVGVLASNGHRQELSASDACRHIDCTGLKDNLNRWNKAKADTIEYRVPVWSASNGGVISPRKPGDKAVNLDKANGDIYGGLILAGVIIIPFMLWLVFGNGKVVG